LAKGTIFVDFDGTIVEHDYPAIGEPLDGAFETLKDLKKAGYKLVLWTCREDDGYKIDRQFLRDAVNFCKENGVEFDGINSTLPEDEFRRDKQGKRKPVYHHIIDDCQIGGIDWQKVREELL
jgi:histidinol phosphatase-like enzyme